MKNLLPLLRDRKTVAAIAAAALGALGLTLSQDVRDALWALLQAVLPS